MGQKQAATPSAKSNKSDIREFHLFAGIYGGLLLGHKCCGGIWGAMQ